MAVYISGIGCISPQNSHNFNEFVQSPVYYDNMPLRCIEPVSYKDFINPVLSRRMGRIIKIGIASALMSIRESNVEMPGAIITGTGLGCVEDTEKFLTSMLDNKETLLNPTNFIQSTYNTISSQIAIILKCFNYNNTYVNRAFSFESALNDAMDLILSGEADSVLAGGVDEMTLSHYEITALTGAWRNCPINTALLLSEPDNGSIPGEGAVFYTLTKEKSEKTYAELAGVKMIFLPETPGETADACISFLDSCGMKTNDVDVLMCGLNGDASDQQVYDVFAERLFADIPVLSFKNLCGEYYTASAFGMWVAANILRSKTIPDSVIYKGKPGSSPSNILIYNHHKNREHVLILLKAV